MQLDDYDALWKEDQDLPVWFLDADVLWKVDCWLLFWRNEEVRGPAPKKRPMISG